MKKAKETFESANIITAEVATTGLMGGDSGHGGVTSVKLTDEAATCWNVTTSDWDNTDSLVEGPKSIEITVQGDTELDTLAASLEWAAKKIRELAGSSE